ncbi:hypothetical protein Y1Q_0007018 [Alligator mississippiensis]|uniref:Uncharacterized protein n=1 Tax=Alligator mississippiensis TaxID=8496 RepID=A0A151N5E9_ALLMI|nr:hypothetical protein Y1Q_0007018 [Alligator mississippiensis]
MPDILLFLWAKYESMICKLTTDAEAKTACLVRTPYPPSQHPRKSFGHCHYQPLRTPMDGCWKNPCFPREE